SIISMDFLVQDEAPGAYDDDVRALGARIIHCAGHKEPWRFARRFRRALRQFGPYDVVHSHVHHYSGYILWLASLSGVRVRIAHSHNDTRAEIVGSSLARKTYL